MIQHLMAKPEQLGQLRCVTGARLPRRISVNAVSFTAGIARAASKVGAAGILSPPLLPQVSAALHQAMGIFFTNGADASPECGTQSCVCTWKKPHFVKWLTSHIFAW